MGCISSKRPESATEPAVDDLEGEIRVKKSTNNIPIRKFGSPNKEDEEEENTNNNNGKKLKNSKSKASNSNFSLSLRFGSSKCSQVVGEQASAGWPTWLTAVAAEAIHGWLPLRADSFQKLEKIGQGTYSNVFRAREDATGRIMALKKVRFDNYHPESVRFMAREITILRKLEHPNVIKLHGLITSKVSCSINLVFEYMEHDLAGLLSSPEVNFTAAQIKCFMQQIFYGLYYCHGKGIMHRDIKTSNILLNNEGVLKLADFGLANFVSARNKQPLTSRVVTLWYRPPELLLGSTNYGPYVDMWSVGCVFAELLVRKPILKGKTEVEQLHKIFKLSGSPPDEFWSKAKLPHATMFKPQAPYQSSLRERFKIFPEPSVNLLENLLSIDPKNRGTPPSCLNSEYFNSMPYACDPASFPKYSPSKEIDTKIREESCRRRNGRIPDPSSSTSRTTQRRNRIGFPKPSSFSIVAGRPGQEENQMKRNYGRARRNGQIRKSDNEIDLKSDVSQDTMFGSFHGRATSLAIPMSSSNRRPNHVRIPPSKSLSAIDPANVLRAHKMLDPHIEDARELDADSEDK